MIMTEIEQMISTLESVERYLRNQELSEIGTQVKGKVLEALKRVENFNIDDVSKCTDCGYKMKMHCGVCQELAENYGEY